jgi:hypothetical protein
VHKRDAMREVSDSNTPLKATFRIKLDGELMIETIGQAHRSINSGSSAEWMEFRSLHSDAKTALDATAENAMMSVQATNALRALSLRAKLLEEGNKPAISHCSFKSRMKR